MAFEVRVRVTVIKIVTCEGCTREGAVKDPFQYAVDEQEIDQGDRVGEVVKEANDDD